MFNIKLPGKQPRALKRMYNIGTTNMTDLNEFINGGKYTFGYLMTVSAPRVVSYASTRLQLGAPFSSGMNMPYDSLDYDLPRDAPDDDRYYSSENLLPTIIKHANVMEREYYNIRTLSKPPSEMLQSEMVKGARFSDHVALSVNENPQRDSLEFYLGMIPQHRELVTITSYRRPEYQAPSKLSLDRMTYLDPEDMF